jgi:hypothetical protein
MVRGLLTIALEYIEVRLDLSRMGVELQWAAMVASGYYHGSAPLYFACLR